MLMAKVKDGMEIRVDTPNILKERRAIMEVYDVITLYSVGFVTRVESVSYKTIH